jgi:hypothetical protein
VAPGKNTKVKRAGSVVQVVKHLPSKLEALSSSPNTIKKIKNLFFVRMHK